MSTKVPVAGMDEFGAAPDLEGADQILGTHPKDPHRVRNFFRNVAQTGFVFLFLCGVWETMSRLDPSFWPRIILPPITEIAQAFGGAITTDFLWSNLWVTVQEGMAGFLIGATTAFIIGVLIALSPLFSRATYPLIVAFQSMPHSALAPVFIAWLGFGMSSKVALVITSCFFPVLVCTVAGLRVIEENKLLLMRSFKATKYQEFSFLRLPNAMPTIFAGIQTAAVAGVVSAVFAEMIGSQEGMGHLIKAASFQFRMADVFAYLIVLSIVGLLIFGIVVLIQRSVIAWSRESKTD
jgi:NitT/TauT family transport system permease protein